MSLDEHQPASIPHDPPRWEQRLRVAVQWYSLVILGSVPFTTDALPIHLAGAPQQIADIVLTAEFVAFLPAGLILIVQEMRRNPATSGAQAWGFRLLVTGSVGLGALLAYWRITGYLSEQLRSHTEIVTLIVLGALMFVLSSLGLALVGVALVGELWQLARPRHRGPLA